MTIPPIPSILSGVTVVRRLTSQLHQCTSYSLPILTQRSYSHTRTNNKQPLHSSHESLSSALSSSTIEYPQQYPRQYTQLTPQYGRQNLPYHVLESRRCFGVSLSRSYGETTGYGTDLKDLDPNKPPSPLKNPKIPEGHPVDTDGRPLGLFIPDYDVELPIFSFGGYTKDFEAWTEPPIFPSTVWPKIAKYDYSELELNNFPVVYEVDVLRVLQVLSVLGLFISVVGTRWETKRYYEKNGEFYNTGWPHFHYEPTLDVVPLTPREDGLPPESLILQFEDESMLRHEMEEPESEEEPEPEEKEGMPVDMKKYSDPTF